MARAAIFLYGQDASLLETRRWVLETSGYRVRATTQFSEIGALICVDRVDLLILCHSLTGKECELSSALVRSRWPSVLTLVLAAGDASYPSEMAGMVLDAVKGPAKLISTVAQLVSCDTTPDSQIQISARGETKWHSTKER